jgi:hypothetical protein
MLPLSSKKNKDEKIKYRNYNSISYSNVNLISKENKFKKKQISLPKKHNIIKHCVTLRHLNIEYDQVV